MSDLFNELYFYKEAWLQKFLMRFIIATQNAKHHIINLTKILQFYRNYYFHNLNYDYMCVHVCVRTMFMLQWGNDVKMSNLPNSTLFWSKSQWEFYRAWQLILKFPKSSSFSTVPKTYSSYFFYSYLLSSLQSYTLLEQCSLLTK